MKNIITILLVLLLCTFSVKADNWELFPSNQKTYFYFESEGNGKMVVPYYVDFEEPEGEFTRQYPLRKLIEEATGGCYDDIQSEVPNIIGTAEVPYDYRLRKTEDRFEYVFGTYAIPIYTQSEVGENWDIQVYIFTNYRPYDRLKVTCTAIELEEIVAGVTDNVKTFEIEAFDGEIPIDAAIEDYQIKVSEKYGLVEWFNFEGWVVADPKVKMTLAGFETENGEAFGEILPKAADFYPYTPGSILKWNNGDIDTILSVERTADSIFYDYKHYHPTIIAGNQFYGLGELKRKEIAYLPQNFIDLYYWNLGMTNSNTFHTLDLERLEGENGEVEYILTTFMEATFFDDCRVIQFVDLGSVTHVYDTKVGFKEYIEGGEGFGGGSYIRLLEAFIAEEDFTSIEEIPSSNLSWSISPNPTQDYLTIQLNETSLQSIQLQIFNLQGEVMLQAAISGGQLEVRTVDFPKGIYFVQVSDGVNQWTEKVVKY